MGGTRFAGRHDVVRIDRATHDAVADQVTDGLLQAGVVARTLPSIRSKTSFGDVDLLVAMSSTHHGLTDGGAGRADELAARDARMAQMAGALDHMRESAASPTLHLIVETAGGPVQVDVTSVDDRILDFAEAHLAYGDAGNFACVVARQMGMTMGMNGLRLVMDTPNGRVTAAIDATYAEALTLTGYDADAHAAGFDTLEDIFRWVAEGRYFDPRIWRMDWRTNRARAKAAKRPAYGEWLRWIDEAQPPVRYHWGNVRGERMSEWAGILAQRYPEAWNRLQITADAAARPEREPLRRFLTGERVTAATGVAGKRLEHLMNNIRKEAGTEQIMRMAQDHDEAGFAKLARRIAGLQP